MPGKRNSLLDSLIIGGHVSVLVYAAAVDILTEVLSLAAVHGSVAASVAAGGDWGIELDAVPGAAFHAIASGTATLLLDGRTPIQLSAGDVVLLPSGMSHGLAARADAALLPFDNECAEMTLGSGTDYLVGEPPATTRILCASYRHSPSHSLATFSLLPEVLHVSAFDAPIGLRSSLQLLGDELAHPGPGYRAVLDHIVNVLLIQVFRTWIEDDRAPRAPSWLRGLGDPVTRSALVELHADPARPWTVDGLARHVGVSRATLARRFASEVGTTPHEYLTTWRMELAAERLRAADEPMATVARGAGYSSEYAFNRAFARHHGMAPGRYRRAARS